MSARWYVVQTKSRNEFLADTELTRDGIEVFCPRVKANPPRAGQPYTPLFPGYLFLQCDPESQGWPSFREAHRIIGWVNFGGELPFLPDGTVEALKQRCKSIDQKGGFWERFLPGEKVQVVSDSLEGLAEIVEEAKSPEARVRVLVKFMGGLVKAQVPWQNLRHVNSPATEAGGMCHQPIAKPTVRRRTRGGGRRTKEYKEYRKSFGASA